MLIFSEYKNQGLIYRQNSTNFLQSSKSFLNNVCPALDLNTILEMSYTTPVATVWNVSLNILFKSCYELHVSEMCVLLESILGAIEYNFQYNSQ